MKHDIRKRKPSEESRAKLNERVRRTLIRCGVSSLGELSDWQKKTPSERKSIMLKRRLEKRE